jgi:hypothetical protein
MDTLRSQVQDSDVHQFDRLTDQARKDAQDAIKEYLGNFSKDCSLSGSSIRWTIKNQWVFQKYMVNTAPWVTNISSLISQHMYSVSPCVRIYVSSCFFKNVHWNLQYGCLGVAFSWQSKDVIANKHDIEYSLLQVCHVTG